MSNPIDSGRPPPVAIWGPATPRGGRYVSSIPHAGMRSICPISSIPHAGKWSMYPISRPLHVGMAVDVPHMEHLADWNGGLCSPHGASRTPEWWSIYPTWSISHVGMAVVVPHIERFLNTIVSQKEILMLTECGDAVSVDFCGRLVVGRQIP